ncbi:MAG TPA: hypothetical protein VF766_00840 [Pyrinomonadaceae bacterium]
MKLPNFEQAVVEIAKLRDYSLNPLHNVGKHKARVFQAALGLTLADADWLREKLLEAARNEEALTQPASIFGEKYIIDVLIVSGERNAVVRTSWIVEYGTDFPRLTSCYVL